MTASLIEESNWGAIMCTPASSLPETSNWGTFHVGPLPDSFLRIPGPEEEPMTAEERDREMAVALQVTLDNIKSKAWFWEEARTNDQYLRINSLTEADGIGSARRNASRRRRSCPRRQERKRGCSCSWICWAAGRWFLEHSLTAKFYSKILFFLYWVNNLQ